jgi:tRNA threonylcarbamoyladenosine biosynthesis protein TsaE
MESYAEFTLSRLEELPHLAKQLLALAGDQKIWLFEGEMGVGKTTLIKVLCQELGVEENTSSPTFSIVNEYSSDSGPVYHFDFYRIRREEEALDMGYEEYFYSGNYCFVEWPEKIAGLLPDDAFRVELSLGENLERHIKVRSL